MKRMLSFVLTLVLLLGLMPMTAFAVENPASDWEGRSAVFVGDSITAGSGTTKIYYEYLAESLGFGSVTDMGVSGSCISNGSDYGDSNSPLINRYKTIPSAAYIQIFMSTNDFGHATPIGAPDDTQSTTFYGALNTIVPYLVDAHENSKIVFVTPLHRNKQSSGNTSAYDNVPNKSGHTLEEYVVVLKEVCDKYGVSVIDLYTECTLDPTDAETCTLYMPDGLHPNAAGHELIAGIMESHIRAITPSEKAPESETELIYGNKFTSGINRDLQNRASARLNLYLKAGTVITLKDPNTFQWSCAKTGNETSNNNLGYFPDSAWTDKETAVVETDGWVGFVFKYRDETRVFDLTKPLSEYIIIEEPHTHTYENGSCIGCEEKDPNKLELNGLNVLCLGDSITAGQGLTTDTRWTNVLASKYGWNLTNKSQGGISLSSYYYTANGKSDVSIAKKAEVLKTMTTKPDVIIVWGGHNDTSYRYSPLGTWDDETTDSFKGALKYIAELADEYAPDATLFVLTPLLTTEAPSTLKVPANTTDTNWMFVDAIYEGAEAYGWIPINMDLCGITPFTISGLTLDSVHPNAAGTEKIVEYLSAELASYGANSKKQTILFNHSSVSIENGKTTTLKAVLSPRSGNGSPVFTWSSSNSSVATVDANGKITAVAHGNATITATADNGVSATVKVSVAEGEHTYTATITAPTCTEQGYTTYSCECGDSYVDDYVDARHSYKHGTCTSCGCKYKETTVDFESIFSQNTDAIATFITKYERKEVDEFNQLTICMAGDSILGRQDKGGSWKENAPEISYTPDMNNPSETRCGYQTGHFPPNMWVQTVPYKTLEELQWSDADVKYYNHSAAEVVSEGSWVDAFPVPADNIRAIYTTSVGANVVFSFTDATHMKVVIPGYSTTSSRTAKFSVEFSTDNGSTWKTPEELGLVASMDSEPTGSGHYRMPSEEYKWGNICFKGFDKNTIYKVKVTNNSTARLSIWGFETWSKPRINVVVVAEGGNTASSQQKAPQRFYSEMYNPSLVIYQLPYLNDLGQGPLARYIGKIDLSTAAPSSPTAQDFYYCKETGVYTNFGGVSANAGDYIEFDGSTWKLGSTKLESVLNSYKANNTAVFDNLAQQGIPVVAIITHAGTYDADRPFGPEVATPFLRDLVGNYDFAVLDINAYQRDSGYYTATNKVIHADGTHLNDKGVQMYMDLISPLFPKVLSCVHQYETAVTAPTCTEQGYTTYTCACGDSYVADYVDATGEHTWGNWAELVAPTCDAEGTDRRICETCGEEQNRDTRITGDPNRILVSNPLTKDYFAGKRVLLIGDSITAGVGTTKTYGAYLAESLGVTVTNKGSSGSGYCSGGAMATNKNLTEANVRNADIITIMLGVNDWDWAVKEGSWKGNPEYYDKSQTYYQLGDFNSTDTSTFYGALHAWCQKILAMQQIEGFEDKQFIVITPLITSWNVSVTSKKDWNQDKLNIHGHAFREYCTAIMEVCAYYDIPVFDANMFSGIYYKSAENNNVAETGGDGVHVNEAGHALLAESLEEFLLEGYTYETRSVKNGGHTYVNGICADCRLPYACNHVYNAVITAPTCTEQGYTTYTCECGDSYVADYTDVRPLNILMIGNSFSWDAADFWYDMQTSMTYDAMKAMLADQYDVHLAVMYKGSATLGYHATCAENNTGSYTFQEIGPETNYVWQPSDGKNASNKILEHLQERDWDIIVIQSYQHEADGADPRSTYTGGSAKFEKPSASLGFLLDYFAQNEPGAEVYYYMPWSSVKFYGAEGTAAGFEAIGAYTGAQIVHMTGTSSGKKLAGIIPVGTAIENARTTYLHDLRYSSGVGDTALLKDPQIGLLYDTQHLSFGVGRYIAGLTVARSVIPQEMRKESVVWPSIKESPSAGILPEEYSLIARTAVENAMQNPYEITAISGYDTDPAHRICDAIEAADFTGSNLTDEASVHMYLETTIQNLLASWGNVDYTLTIHDYSLENGVLWNLDADITVSIGYTTGTTQIYLTEGTKHRYGDWVHISIPTPDSLGVDQRVCTKCGYVQRVEVEGSWQKYDLADHLQELPDSYCAETNLWDLLNPEVLMLDQHGNWVDVSGPVYSVTIPLSAGDRVLANSFIERGIQVSFIGEYGIIKTYFSGDTKRAYQENGCLIAPEGTIAVNIPVWDYTDDNELYILNAEHTYIPSVTAPTCTEQGYTTYTCDCGDSYVDDYVDADGEHDFTEWSTIKEAAYNADGEESRKCNKCSHVEFRSVFVSVVTSGNLGKGTTPTDKVIYTLYSDGTMVLEGTGALFGIDWRGDNQPFIDYRKQIKHLIIGEGITSTTSGSLVKLSNLETIQFPSTLTHLPQNALMSCFRPDITELTIPATVVHLGAYSIGHYTGDNSAYFTDVIIENPNIQITDHNAVFNGGAKLDQLTLYSYGENNNVSAYAEKYGIRYVDLNNYLEGEYGDIHYELSDGVLILEPLVDNASVPTGNQPWESYADSITKIIVAEGIVSIPGNAFADYSSLTEVVLPSGLDNIGDGAFSLTQSNATSLTMTLPRRLSTLGKDIFKGRSNVELTVYSGSLGADMAEPGVKLITKKVFKILLIGNSYSEDASNGSHTAGSQLLDILQAMLGEDTEITVALLSSGGKGMHWHATQAEQGNTVYSFKVITSENPVWKSQGSYASADALAWTDWDVVSLQPYNINVSTGQESVPYPDSTDPKFYHIEDSSSYMLDHVACYAPYADIYFYMHWAQTSGTVLNSALSSYNKAAAFMPQVLEYAGKKSGAQFKTIIPVGLSIQNARTTYLALLRYNTTAYADGNLNLVTDAQIGLQRDGGHVSFNIGRYIAALTFAETIIPEEQRADGYTLPDIRITESVGKLPKEYTIIAQKAVKAAVDSWKQGSLAVTDIAGYKEDPTIAASETLKDVLLNLPCDDTVALTEQIRVSILEILPADFAVDNVDVSADSGVANVTIRFGYTAVTVEVLFTKLSHDYSAEWTVDVAPACTTAGSKSHHCTGCDKKADVTEIPSTGHTYGAWYTIKAPTCTEKGTDEHKCSACQHTETRTVSSLGHTESAAVVENRVNATCAAEGSYDSVVYCSVCGYELSRKTNKIDKLAHTYTTVVTKPTCTKQGYTTHTCKCGDSYVDTYVEALGHNFGEWYTTVAPTESVQGEKRRDCSKCDAYETYVIEVLDHDHYRWEIIVLEAKTPTCTESGLTEGSKCSKCGEILAPQNTVPATGHTFGKWYTTKSPTCTAKGEEKRGCANCDYFETRTVDKIAHTYTTVVTKPTCTKQGYTTHTCKCGDSYVDTYVDATGHGYGKWYTTKSPTCTAMGTERRDCGDCGHYEERSVAALGHDEIDHSAKAPTCTEIGWYSYVTCSRCDYTTYVEIKSLGHEYSSAVTKPDCENGGYTTHTCSRCGDSYTDSKTDALGHTEVIDKAVSVTCTETGLTEGKHCSVCGKVLVAQQTVEATGHTFGKWYETKTPTCTAKGEEKRECANCDRFETRTVDKIAHTYTTVVTKPTCTKQGYTTHTCVCGDGYVDTYVEAAGHSFTNYVSDGNATFEADGTKTAVCDNGCGVKDTVTDEGSKLKHNDITSEIYEVKDSLISGISVKTTVKELKESVNETGYVRVVKDGKVVTDNTALATGMKIQLMNGTEVVKEVTVVVTGDTNGDGNISVTDMISVKAHILEKSTLTDAYGKAGDTNGDGKISITDFIQIKAHILGKSSLEKRSVKAIDTVTYNAAPVQEPAPKKETAKAETVHTVCVADFLVPAKNTFLMWVLPIKRSF